MPDVFDVLRADHEEVKQMLAELETVPSHSDGGTKAVLEARKKLAERLIIEYSKHEPAEAQYFWPAVRDRALGGNELADQAISQEQEAKAVLAKLDKLDPAGGGFDKLTAEFIPAAREHIAFEQDKVWPVLWQALSAQEAEQLGEEVKSAKESAPTSGIIALYGVGLPAAGGHRRPRPGRALVGGGPYCRWRPACRSWPGRAGR